jgi:hypothetical protein
MFLHRARNEIPFVVTDRKEITHQNIRSPRYAPSVEPASDLLSAWERKTPGKIPISRITLKVNRLGTSLE